MKRALLIIDIQNDYFARGANPLPNANQASQNAKRLLEEFRKNNQQIIHIQHIASKSDATFFKQNTKGADIQEDVLLKMYIMHSLLH